MFAENADDLFKQLIEEVQIREDLEERQRKRS